MKKGEAGELDAVLDGVLAWERPLQVMCEQGPPEVREGYGGDGERALQ